MDSFVETSSHETPRMVYLRFSCGEGDVVGLLAAIDGLPACPPPAYSWLIALFLPMRLGWGILR